MMDDITGLVATSIFH